MAYPSLPALTAEHDTVVPLDFESLWSEALNKYKDITGTDLRLSEQELLRRLSGCKASDEVLKILEDFVDAFRAKRSGTTRWEKLKVSLEPVVLTVLRFGNHVGGELAQASSLPGGSAVFVALAVLLKAAQDVSARQDDVLHLFERLQAFFERLSVRALIPTSYGSRRIVVKLLIELLELFSIATKMLKSTRMSQFLNALLRQDDIQLAFRRIDALTSSEHQMTSTETLSVSHDLLERLNLVGKHALENLIQHTDLVVRNVQQATTLLADKTDKHTSDIRGDIVNSDNRQLRIAEYLRKEVKESSSDIREHFDHHLNVVTHGELARHTTVIRGDMRRLLVQRNKTGLSPEQVKQATYVIGAAVMLSSIPVLPLWVQKFPLLAALFYMYQMMIPKELSPIDANTFSIMLIDAFGDPVTLPLMNCSSWNDLHIALMNHFSTRDGAGLVKMGAYEIEDGKTRRVIDAQSWAKTVKADMFVVMNMVVPQYLSSVKCPRCGTVNEKDSFKDREQVACASCNHVYRVSGIELPPADISEVHPFANSPVSLTRKQHYGPDPPGAKKVPTYAMNMGAPDRGEDLSPFQNIHILFSADLSVPALSADSTDAPGVATSSPSPSSSSTHESHARAPLSLGPSGTWTIQKTFRAPRSVLVYSESAKIVSKVWFHSPPLSVSDAASVAAVQITTHSRDQGFVDFPQHNSWSWFEIGVVPTGANGQPDFMRARWLHSHNNQLGDAEIVQRQGQVIGKEQGQWRAGDVIAVSVRAQFPGWLNFAAAGELRFLESVQSMV